MIFTAISAIFFIILIMKEVLSVGFRKKMCTLCLSVSLVWFLLLILYFLGIFTNKVIIALLMGHTSLGIFYTIERKIKKLRLFRLPILLSLIFIFYFLVEGFVGLALLFLIALWVIFLFIYSFKQNKRLRLLFTKILECCKKW